MLPEFCAPAGGSDVARTERSPTLTHYFRTCQVRPVGRGPLPRRLPRPVGLGSEGRRRDQALPLLPLRPVRVRVSRRGRQQVLLHDPRHDLRVLLLERLPLLPGRAPLDGVREPQEPQRELLGGHHSTSPLMTAFWSSESFSNSSEVMAMMSLPLAPPALSESRPALSGRGGCLPSAAAAFSRACRSRSALVSAPLVPPSAAFRTGLKVTSAACRAVAGSTPRAICPSR